MVWHETVTRDFVKRAINLIRNEPHYRKEAFDAGLKAVGYDVSSVIPKEIRSTDVLCIWNRYGARDEYACQFERVGARVIVAENGYIGHDDKGRQLYAISLDRHLGSGRWYIGDEERWLKQNIRLRPWRQAGYEIVLLPQRGFGPKPWAQPDGWIEKTLAEIKQQTTMTIRVRSHPGNQAHPISPDDLETDLRNAKAVVTWASSAAVKAMAMGIPVFFTKPGWVAEKGGVFGLWNVKAIESQEWPWPGVSRGAAFHKIGWAQWSIDEITSGTPFHCLLDRLDRV